MEHKSLALALHEHLESNIDYRFLKKSILDFDFDAVLSEKFCENTLTRIFNSSQNQDTFKFSLSRIISFKTFFKNAVHIRTIGYL